MAAEGASDLHLATGEPPVLRLDGRLDFLDEAPVDMDEAQAFIDEILSPEHHRRFREAGDCDLSIEADAEARLRINIFRAQGGIAMALRHIPTRIPSLREIGAPSPVAGLLGASQGLILVTGPTGSGKSTTLAAMIEAINSSQSRHIITIEDPIEYRHGNLRSLIRQREVGRDTPGFQEALRAALREDPDVLLVGEMRDLPTIALALTAAETGHLVLATLHTSSAARAVNRIVDVFPSSDKELIRAQLASSLTAVIAQRLLPREAGGRIAAFELMIGTDAVRNLIREGKTPQIASMIQLGSRVGMQTMDDALEALVEAGEISPRTAQAALGEFAGDAEIAHADERVAPRGAENGAENGDRSREPISAETSAEMRRRGGYF